MARRTPGCRRAESKRLLGARSTGAETTTLDQRNITLPEYNRDDPSTVNAWRQASAAFARGAQGNVVVLQGDRVRTTSVWAEVEYPALTTNPNVTSITAINPETGASTLLWTR